MARFIPPLEPDQFTNAGERTVAKALAKALDDSYTVYHHVDWLPAESDPNQIEGETDFVICHQRLGILILEVKGGRILLESGEWFYDTGSGRPTRMKDPVRQARAFLHELLPRLKKVYDAFYVINYAVALPHEPWNRPLPCGLTAETLFDRPKCQPETIGLAIRNAMKESRLYRGREFSGFDDAAQKAIRVVLGETSLFESLGHRMRLLDERLLKLSREQAWVRR